MALVIVARYHGVVADVDQIQHESAEGVGRLSNASLVLAARDLKLKAKKITVKRKRLNNLPLPAIALSDSGKHFIIARVDADRILIQDPLEERPTIVSADDLFTRWGGEAIVIASRASIVGDLMRFDFSWFIPAVIKYRRLLLEVLLVSLFLQSFALVSPLFFQVVMDKVLVHRGYTTLDVVCIGLLFVSIFEVILSGLRSYVFSHTTNRIDVELGARLFRHLLALPLSYFGSRRVGDTVARVRELENIRSFLTGQTLTAILDLLFSVIFIAVMLFYSVWLTIIVIVSLPCYAIISAIISPILRDRLNVKFAKGADNQSFLVETVSGVETVKSMAVEPQFTRRWDNQLAAYVASSFRVTSLATLGQQGVQLISKLVTVSTLWLGARLVIEGELTVGQLIAFNMLANHVSAPVIRLAQLWQDFQQVGISMSRLGDVLNSKTEIPPSRQPMPPLHGGVEFEQVHFQYKIDGPMVLQGIDLSIPAGQIIGVVGRSGSGKSTLTKILQRLYLPTTGRVRVDGMDLALADPAWLRRQIGVVLQENLLFNRSIRENIALTDPGLPLENIIQAAKLAGAHEFIIELAEGYDSIVGEHGQGLSGGQRQRIALARALVGNPRILILDEATSALDYESERIIQNNMRAICKGRTVIIIAHRLSAVRGAHKIIVMDKGHIVESGSHDELRAIDGGHYAHLLKLQAGGE